MPTDGAGRFPARAASPEQMAINLKHIASVVRGLPRWMAVLAAFTLAGAGFGAGWLAGVQTSPVKDRTEGAWELHQGGYRFINPLLECTDRGDSVDFVELRPFQDKVQRLIQRRAPGYRISAVSFYFRDLNNGPWFGIEERKPFTPASLLKLPIVIACLKQAEEDPSFLARHVRFDLPDDRNVRQYFKPSKPLVRGRTYTVEELIRRAIRHSDNNASFLLAREVSEPVLLAVFRDLNVPAPKLSIQYDFLSPKAYAAFFRVLFNSSYLGRDMSQRLLEELAQSEFRDGITAGVPDYILVAHKFGEYAETAPAGMRQIHDCGIVYYPGHPYLLCVMSRGSDINTLDDMIRDISQLVYEEVDRQYRSAYRDSPL